MFKKFILYIFLLFVPLLAVAMSNLILDSRSYYSDRYAVSLAKDLSKENLSIFREPSFRIVKKELIKMNSGKNFSKVILGSSRTMHLGNDDERILNISIPGAVFEDYEILLDILNQENISFDTIIVSAHPWLFNKNHNDIRYKSFNSSYLLDSIEYALSWKYFCDNISPNKYIKWDGNDNDFVIFKNGTVRFDKKYRTYIPDVSHYVSNAINGTFNNFLAIDSVYKTNFEKILNNLSLTHKVELILLPFHNDVYDELIKRIPVVSEIEKLYFSYGKENILVFGSYDPKKLNLSKRDFYDANHMRSESLELFYKKRKN